MRHLAHISKFRYLIDETKLKTKTQQRWGESCKGVRMKIISPQK
jgi:hypothetical protein